MAIMQVDKVVEIGLGEIVSNDLETFLDILSVRATDSEMLMNIGHIVVGHKENELYIRVTGELDMLNFDEDEVDALRAFVGDSNFTIEDD